jgi:hypothetical protein
MKIRISVLVTPPLNSIRWTYLSRLRPTARSDGSDVVGRQQAPPGEAEQTDLQNGLQILKDVSELALS